VGKTVKSVYGLWYFASMTSEYYKRHLSTIRKIKKKDSFWRRVGKFWSRLNKARKIAVGISASLLLLFGTLLIPKSVKEVKHEYEPQSMQYEDGNFIKGILVPLDVIKDGVLTIRYGTNLFQYSVAELYDGVEFRTSDVGCATGAAVPIVFKLEDNRLYVSDSIFSYENKHLIGVLNYNKYEAKGKEIYKPLIQDNLLEIYDEQGHVAFSIETLPSGELLLHGYFITDNNIAIISDTYSPCNHDNDDFILKMIKSIPKHKP
jgi:hypothetical protein